MPDRMMNVQVQVRAKAILETPELVLQQMSMRIHQRRDQLIEDLIGTRMTYKATNGDERTGIVERIGGNSVHLDDNGEQRRVSIGRMRI